MHHIHQISLTIASTIITAIFFGNTSSQAAEPPSKIIDLRNWKLTLPFDTPRSGSPDEVTQPALSTFSDATCFFVSDSSDAIVFRAACGGSTTKTSSYSRAELREMKPDGKSEIAWSTEDKVLHQMEVQQAILATPEKKPHVVCAQIHDAKDDLLMVRLEKQKLFIERNGAAEVILDSQYKLGTQFKLHITAGEGRVRVAFNGEERLNWEVSKKGCYFKVGCYTQSNVSKGDAPEAYGEVAVYQLSVSH